jgi:hypothetical protein
MVNLDWATILGIVACIWLLLPCRYDPAIRLKEWLEREEH